MEKLPVSPVSHKYPNNSGIVYTFHVGPAGRQTGKQGNKHKNKHNADAVICMGLMQNDDPFIILVPK